MGKCKCNRNMRIKQLGEGVTSKSGKMCQWCIEEAKKAEQEKFEHDKEMKAALEEFDKKKPDMHFVVKPEEVGPVTVTPKAKPNVRVPNVRVPKTTKPRSLDDNTAFGEE